MAAEILPALTTIIARKFSSSTVSSSHVHYCRNLKFPARVGCSLDVTSLLNGSAIPQPGGKRIRRIRLPVQFSWTNNGAAMSAVCEHSRNSDSKGGECTIPASDGNNKMSQGSEAVKAAFFDVDGTITGTNVVLAYFAVRMTELSFLMKLLWLPWFGLTGIFYLLVDRIDRATFNRFFYLSYKGRSVDCKARMATLIYERYYLPRIFPEAAELVHQLKQKNYKIVFVTGALDFQITPLAQELRADFVYAAELIEENGRFTGKLKGMATSNYEKAERVLEYANKNDISLRDSLAFGDSIADVSMLELVGAPHVVNPDSRLRDIALKRGWPILQWNLLSKRPAPASAYVRT